MSEVRVRSADELRDIATAFLSALTPRADGATIITLSGELGAGKTTFTQALARELGIIENVSSPTFVIEKIYLLTGQRWRRLIHIDAYRLRFAKELVVLGWDELLKDPEDLIVLEWPEKVPELIPAYARRVQIDIEGEERIITINDGEKS
jgi:tRNA threonylcarbamoyladenosine biosynthesis protein TsaE